MSLLHLYVLCNEYRKDRRDSLSTVSQWSQAALQQGYFRCKKWSAHTQISTAPSKTFLLSARDNSSSSERLWQRALPSAETVSAWLFTAFSAARCLQIHVKLWNTKHWKLTPLSSIALVQPLLAVPFSNLQPQGPSAHSHINQ